MTKMDIRRKTPYEPRFNAEFKDNEGQIEVTSPDPITLDDVLKIADVDQEIWEVVKIQAGGHQVSMRIRSGAGSSVPDQPMQVWNNNWKIWVKRKVAKYLTDSMDTIVARLAKNAPKRVSPKKYQIPDDPIMCELALYDAHFGKLAWRRETLEDQDLKIAEAIFDAATDDLLNMIAPYPIEQFLVPVGNDFFHINDASNTTPIAHNSLDVEGRLAKVYEVGVMAIIRTIDKLLQIAPVHVLFVPGNHDQQTALFLIRELRAWYSNEPNFSADIEPTFRKYYQYGKTLLGFTHLAKRGTKPDRLGGLMAKETKLIDGNYGEHGSMFDQTSHHEFHVGDQHRLYEWEFVNTKEELGFRVRQLPALTAQDAWHYQEGYVLNYRAAEAFLWHKEKCYLGHFNCYVSEETAIASPPHYRKKGKTSK